MSSQVPPGSQVPQHDRTRKQRKGTVFTKEQIAVLKEYFEKCMYLTKEHCVALADRFGVTEHQIKIWFKNSRAKKRREKSQNIPENPECETPDRPAFPKVCESLVASDSADSVCQGLSHIGCPPQLSPLNNSTDQESIFHIIDHPLDKTCSRKSQVSEKQWRQKHREPPGKKSQQSSSGSGLHQICSPPSPMASANSMCKRPLRVSAPPLLRPPNTAPNSESVSSKCSTLSPVSSPPQPSPLSNFPDQKSILENIDRACKELILKNTRLKQQQQQQQQQQNRTLQWKQGQDSCPRPASPKGTVREDSPPQIQSVFSYPAQLSPSSTSLNSESSFSTWERLSHISSPPPLSLSVLPDPESTFSRDQTTESVSCGALKCVQDSQFPAGDRLPGQSAACASSAHPATAQDAASAQASYSSPASPAGSTADTKAAGSPGETPSADTTEPTEDVQDHTTLQDEFFLEHLGVLDAILDQVSQPDFVESFIDFELLMNS